MLNMQEKRNFHCFFASNLQRSCNRLLTLILHYMKEIIEQDLTITLWVKF